MSEIPKLEKLKFSLISDDGHSFKADDKHYVAILKTRVWAIRKRLRIVYGILKGNDWVVHGDAIHHQSKTESNEGQKSG